jgi:hypothetical protein
MSRKIIIFFLLFTLLFSACSSFRKKAEKHFEVGAYEEAIRLYELALVEDINDNEARLGLKKARDGLLDKDLISVRLARLAGNQQQALDLLLSVIEKEVMWKYSPTAKVAFTQAEESNFAVQYLQGRVKNSIQQKKPVLGEFLLLHYKSIFQEPQAISRFDSLKLDVLQSGKQSCKQFQQGDQSHSPYFSDFLIRYCTHFAESCDSCATISKLKLNELYGNPDVIGDIPGLPSELTDFIKNDLRLVFEQTPWYDPSGKNKTQLVLNGTYSYSHQRQLTNLVHQYSEVEPYEAWEQVRRSRQVPYTDYRYHYDSQLRQTVQTPFTNYRTEYYDDAQKVTRYRTVNRSFPYSAIKHEQKIGLSLSSTCKVLDRQVSTTFQDRSYEDGYEHDLNLPNIGLRPSRPNLKDKFSWVKTRSKELPQLFKEQAQAEWVAAYCRNDSNTTDPRVLADQVQKCLRGKSSSISGFVNEWYELQLGLSYEKAEEVLAK